MAIPLLMCRAHSMRLRHRMIHLVLSGVLDGFQEFDKVVVISTLESGRASSVRFGRVIGCRLLVPRFRRGTVPVGDLLLPMP